MIEGKSRIGEKREVKYKPKAIKRWRATRDTSRKTTQPSTTTFDDDLRRRRGNGDRKLRWWL